MGRRTAAAGLALLGIGGYLTFDVLDVAPGVLTRAPLPPTAALPSAAPTALLPTPTAPTRMPVRPAGTDAPLPSTAGLAAALAAVLADPALAGAGVTVRDALTGAHLFDAGADAAHTPASTTKLLTALAVEAAFPAGSVLRTSVRQGERPERIVLVAGGDMLLSPLAGDPTAVAGRAGLADLADAVAAALRASGRTSAVLQVDGGYAPGPAVAASWPPRFVATGLTGLVAMLGLSSRQAIPGAPAPGDPVGAVAATLATRLTERGIATTVEATPARSVAAPSAAPTGSSESSTPGATAATVPGTLLGEVVSAPVTDLLALALLHSDNALTESLLRQAAARAGRPTDFAGAAAYAIDAVRAAGIDVTGVVLHDGSGLTAANKMPARVLGDVLTYAVSGRRPELTRALAGLPVAGLSGTLADRFAAPVATAAAGIVRAKTGTLIGVRSLAGTVVTRDGRLLVFAALAEGQGTDQAPAALDRLGATLVQCGCR